MTKKVLDFAIISVGIVFLCWYLPVAFYNVYACDDYWYGSNVRLNGFWGNQLFYYINWEGSFTHTFFASLPHLFHGSHIPFLGNIYSLVLLFGSLFFFLRTYTNLSTKRGLIYTLYLLSFLFLCTKGDSEIRFWINANITYLSSMSFLLIFFALYHNVDNKSSIKKWFLTVLCIFLIGGSKLTFIVYAIAGMVIHDILFEKKISRRTLLIYSFLAGFVAFNVFAPGNYIRLAKETMANDVNEHMSLIESVLYRITGMENFLINAIFLLPISAQWVKTSSFKNKRVIAALAVLGVAIIIDSIVMYICFHNPGPLRVYFVAEVMLSLLVLFGLNHFYTSVLCKYYYSRHVMILFAFMVAASHTSLFFQIPPSIEFSEKARERDRYVMSCSTGETLKITQLPPSYLMLSYFANDPIWLERIYLPYFQKKNKFVLLGPHSCSGK